MLDEKLLQGLLNGNSHGNGHVDHRVVTSIPGVYALGDVRTKKIRQIFTAVNGTVAARFAENYLLHPQRRALLVRYSGRKTYKWAPTCLGHPTV